ncbi:hypothetical protein [Roseateles sp. MS654]|uniref:hypothetical protein n=1 Tax=Roseateles sp. MS654 TaxID=3412685 RepID=UPI003C301CEB
MSNARALELWEQLFEQGRNGIAESGEWHWFAYHFTRKAGHVMPCSIVDACVDCELASPGLSTQFMNDLASVCGRETYLFDFTDHASPALAAKLLGKRGSLQLEVGPEFFDGVVDDDFPH